MRLCKSIAGCSGHRLTLPRDLHDTKRVWDKFGGGVVKVKFELPEDREPAEIAGDWGLGSN